MKTYKLPVAWEMVGLVEVEAESLEEAVAYFENNSDHIKLPYGEYVYGTLDLSNPEIEIIEEINEQLSKGGELN